MSQVKQLKDHLEAKFTNYKRHLNSLVRAVGEQGTSVRALKSKIETFESSLESLNAAHTSWVSKAEPSEGSCCTCLLESVAGTKMGGGRSSTGPSK